MADRFGKITKDDVRRILEEDEIKKREGMKSEDLEEWLSSHSWELRNSTDQPTIMFNLTYFLDSEYNMVHQGDLNVEMLSGIRDRIGSHTVYIFKEHSEYRPMCGVLDGTALRPNSGLAKPLGNKAILLKYSDIVLDKTGEATLRYDYLAEGTVFDKYFERAGWKVKHDQFPNSE